MEMYEVTVWDASGGESPEGWVVESPPISERASDSYAAALKVARRANASVKLDGIGRPEGSRDVFFKDPGLEMVYQVHDVTCGPVEERIGQRGRVYGHSGESRGPDEVWEMETAARDRATGKIRRGKKSLPVRRVGPHTYTHYS